MSDEVIDAGTSTDSGDQSSQSSVDMSSQSSGGVDLQDRMMQSEEYWYSDGIDGFYGPDGQPVLKDGKYVRTQEELDAMLGKTQTAKTQQQPAPQGSQQNVSDTLFETEGKYDPVKSNKFLSEIDKPYMPKISQQQQPVPQQQQQLPNAQQQQAEVTKTLAQQIMDYESGLRSGLLDPLIEARDDMVEADRWKDTNPRAVKIDKLIKERTASIDNLVKEKQLQLWEDSFKSKEKTEAETKAAKEIEQQVERSIFNVSKNFNGRDSFESLMIGKTGADGKFIPGSGQDLILAIVDLLHDGQQVSDLGKATKDGWNKIAKSQEILATIAKYVSGYHIAKNLSKNNSLVKQQVLAEERNKNKFGGKTPQSIVPSQQRAGSNPIDAWLGVSTV